MNIGKEIVRLRKARGISQLDLAAAVGLHPSNLCRLEKDGKNPCWETVEKILDVMGCHLKISEMRQSETRK